MAPAHRWNQVLQNQHVKSIIWLLYLILPLWLLLPSKGHSLARSRAGYKWLEHIFSEMGFIWIGIKCIRHRGSLVCLTPSSCFQIRPIQLPRNQSHMAWEIFQVGFFSTCRLGCRRTHCKPECAPSRCPSWRKELPHKQRADKVEPEQKSFWHFEFRFPVLCWWWNHKREVSWSCLQPKRSARLLLLINGDILYISFDYNMGNQPLISDETFQTQNGKILTMISKGDGMSIVLMAGSKTENAFSFFLNCSSFWTETISKGAITFHESTAQLPVWVKIPMEILMRWRYPGQRETRMAKNPSEKDNWEQKLSDLLMDLNISLYLVWCPFSLIS